MMNSDAVVKTITHVGRGKGAQKYHCQAAGATMHVGYAQEVETVFYNLTGYRFIGLQNAMKKYSEWLALMRSETGQALTLGTAIRAISPQGDILLEGEVGQHAPQPAQFAN